MAPADWLDRVAAVTELTSQPDPVGEPKASDFRIEECAIPAPGAGEVLLRTIWLSLDPYMRGRMSDGPSYAAPVPIGGVMEGGTVSEVLEKVGRYADSGQTRLYLQTLDLHDLEHLRLVAERVMPALR